MAVPTDTGVGPPAPPAVPTDIDDLRRYDDLHRSGKIAIWPYIMRELPLSPVDALRLELRSRDAHGRATNADSKSDCSYRRGIQYVPARLENDDEKVITTESKREQAQPTGCEHDALIATLIVDAEREQGVVGTSESTLALRKGRCRNVPIKRRTQEQNTMASPDLQVIVNRTINNGRMMPRGELRPASSGGPRRPRCPPSGEVSSLWHRATSDHTECPLGCGEEIRVNALTQHQQSLCALRYVDCLMPGCPALVQANKLAMHLRRDCLERRRQHTLAENGKALHVAIACDACGEMVAQKHLRAHYENDCGMRMVRCLNRGCGDIVQAKSLGDHQRIDCMMARRNTALIEQAASRPAEGECPRCRKTIAAGLLRRHVADECLMRIVACPNKAVGCVEEVQASEVSLHLRERCVVQIDRAERASRYTSRRQRVQCSGCGYMVVLQYLPRHHRDRCPNRRVPCKHWELGCTAMLRLSTMDEHLKVDRLLDPRSCLVFDSGRAYIALGEDDRKPPWTAEIWIWRPSLAEGTREKARMALKAYWEFQRAREKLAFTKRRIGLLEPLLVEVATRAAKERSTEAEQAREKLTQEMVVAATVRDDAKVDLVVAIVVLSNSLSSATRGVEQITAQNRLRGFDRLALGSTPWYATLPTPAKINAWGKGRRSEGRGHRDRRIVVLRRAPPSNPADAHKGKAVVDPNGETGIENGREQIPLVSNTVAGEESLTSLANDSQSRNLLRPTEEEGEKSSDDLIAPDGAPHGDAHNVETGRPTDMLQHVVEELEVLAAADEAASRQKQAAFWAEWVALTGQSLARKLLSLAGETLPHLKQETVALTGLATEVLFGASGSAGTDTTEGRAMDDDASTTSSTRKGGKTSASRKAEKKAKRKKKHETQFGKNIETRIAEEVNKRSGLETLFGSDKVLFQLEMGQNDQVGVKIAGKKDHIFNYRCPRERWVHLAFVSDATGVFLLENGKTASRLHDIAVPLPMRDIGGRETACQCLVQEVRYWKVNRSKDDLAAWMHEALPSAAVSDGLVGYWTLEEGSGEHVNDATGQRFRAKKIGRGLKWVMPEVMCTVEVGAPPTPSWRERNVCKVELRRGRLAQRGRLHQQFISCPAGCDEIFLKCNARAHAAYRCTMRVVPCSMAACEKRMPAKDLPRHLEEYCIAYSAWVRMAEAGEENQEACSCPHCEEIVKRCNLRRHVKYACQWAKEPCRNVGCGAFIPRIRRLEHERRFCGATSAVRKRRRLARARARSKYKRDWTQDGE